MYLLDKCTCNCLNLSALSFCILPVSQILGLVGQAHCLVDLAVEPVSSLSAWSAWRSLHPPSLISVPEAHKSLVNLVQWYWCKCL